MVSHQLSARACRQEIKAGKRRSLPALLVGAAALLVLLAVAVSYAADLGSSIVVRDAGGEVVSRAPLSGSGGFEIEYVHSYYEAPAAEHFVVAGDGSFGLVEVSSPSEAVLDYYEIEGRKEEADGGRMRLLPDELQSFEELPLIGTEKGALLQFQEPAITLAVDQKIRGAARHQRDQHGQRHHQLGVQTGVVPRKAHREHIKGPSDCSGDVQD